MLKGETVYLDIPENNHSAVDLVQKYGMTKVFATARMYLKRRRLNFLSKAFMVLPLLNWDKACVI